MTREKEGRKIKETVGYYAILGILKPLSFCSLRVLYVISDVLYLLLYHVIRYRRKVVIENLRKAFPEATEQELKGWEKEFYHHLCDVFIEAVKLLHISDEEVYRRIRIEGIDEVEKLTSEGKSVILFLGHLGNWEWVTSIAGRLPEGIVGAQIYHPLSDKIMDRVMLKIRSRFGAENIPMKHTYRRLLEIERSGKKFVCGFISDQRPFGATLHHWTTFMGLDTPYVAGGETIGEKIGAGYLYMDIEKIKRGYYRLTYKPIESDAGNGEENPVTRAYMNMLERSIRRNPPLWLWSHNRWIRHR